MRKTLALLTLIAPLTLVGCANSSSTDIETHGMYADFHASADGTGNTTVYAALKVGGSTSNDFVDVVGDDSLIGTHAAIAQPMSKQEFLGAVWYTTVFAVDSAGAPFKISLNRGASHVSAPNSDATLPAPFSITAPAGGATFSRATAAIPLTWSSSGGTDPMNYVASGDCIVAKSDTLPADNGSYTIPAGSIQPGQNQTGTSCQVTISISRNRAGIIDSAYGEGGAFTATQTRSVTVLSAP